MTNSQNLDKILKIPIIFRIRVSPLLVKLRILKVHIRDALSIFYDTISNI